MMQRCSLRSGSGRWILAATTLASATAFLKMSVVSIALPAIQYHFTADLSGLQWVVNGQLLSLAALLLVGGSLGDHFGRKRVFLVGITIFAVAAAISGLSPYIGFLIVLQAVQGVGAALMVPQSLAIINDCFVPDERGRAIGLWAGLSGGIATLGPVLGGWLVDAFSWRAVFFIIVPISAAAFIIAARSIPSSQQLERRRLDWPGTVLIFLGLAGLVYGLIRGPSGGWDQPLVLASLITGVFALVLFVLVEKRRAEALVPLEIFRNPLVAGANLVTLLLYFALNGVIFFTVLNLQQIRGFTATAAGLGLLPAFLLITIFSGPAGMLADRLGPRLQMMLGPGVAASGMALLITGGPGASYLRNFLPGLALLGMGMALVIAPLTKSALSVEPRFSGAASGVNNAVARVAGLLAIAVLGALAVSLFTAHLAGGLERSGLTGTEQQLIREQSDRLGGIAIPEEFSATARATARQAIDASFIYGFRWAMGVCAALAGTSVVVSALTIRNPQ